MKRWNSLLLSRVTLFVVLTMLISFHVNAQQLTSTGRVVDAMNDPLIGVSVIEKGTSNGAITDMDGNFTLRVPSGAVLQFSYVGYMTQDVKAASTMRVTMQEDNEVLDAVVVIG